MLLSIPQLAKRCFTACGALSAMHFLAWHKSSSLMHVFHPAAVRFTSHARACNLLEMLRSSPRNHVAFRPHCIIARAGELSLELAVTHYGTAGLLTAPNSATSPAATVSCAGTSGFCSRGIARFMFERRLFISWFDEDRIFRLCCSL